MPATILVVDDSRTNREVLARAFAEAGHRVIVAEDGRAALDRIATATFDCIVLDHEMPGLSGVEVLTAIRARAETSDLPVVMVTARSDPAAAIQALAAGADDHVAKPFAIDELRARIDRVIARHRRMTEWKRANIALDARIATRAIELGEARVALAAANVERETLAASLRTLAEELARMRG